MWATLTNLVNAAPWVLLFILRPALICITIFAVSCAGLRGTAPQERPAILRECAEIARALSKLPPFGRRR